MTGQLVLDWAVLAVSLFNTILLLWLGLTVVLTAERQTWGIGLAAGGLLMGGLFFLTHSAILGYGLDFFSPDLDLLWRAGWVPVVILPFAWYAVVLWYAGFFEDRRAPLRLRHRPWFALAAGLAASVIALLLWANPLKSFSQVIRLQLAPTLSLGDLPLLIIVYPLYTLICMGLSLEVLRRPGPTRRVMGDRARARARPWLVAASLALLVAGLLVAGAMLWLTLQAGRTGLLSGMVATVAWLDLAIGGLIGLAVLLLGQAIVSYEVFTGKVLPRQGFARQWRRAAFLAGGYGLLVGWSLTYPLHPIFSLLLGAILMTVFFALLAWRSYAERERFIQDLRPFVNSPRLVEQLLEDDTRPDRGLDLGLPFHTLCAEVLGARQGTLIAVGPLAPLAGPPLVFPQDGGLLIPDPGALAARFDSPQTTGLPLDPARSGGADWAVPLWSERGLIGLFLLGEKADGGMYTQEEIEIARASGERLLDARASAELAMRLMRLQRDRFTHSQVLDRQTRRVLHDDVLPRLHGAVLDLQAGQPGAEGQLEAVSAALAEIHRQISDLLRELPGVTAPDVSRYGLVGALQRLVEEELPEAFDQVTWQVSPEAEARVLEIPHMTAEVIFYAAREVIRNAARHGRPVESGRPFSLEVRVDWRQGLLLEVQDNGVGMSPAEPSPASTAGQGLALHSTMMAVVGGSLTVDSAQGKHTCARITFEGD